MVPLSMTFVEGFDPDFKVAICFDMEYLRNDTIFYNRASTLPSEAGAGYAGDLTPQLFMWGILICISH